MGVGLHPVSAKHVTAIRKDMHDPPPKKDTLVYLQEEAGDEFVAGLRYRSRWQFANWGETIIRMDSWEFYTMCGAQ
jgi:hypothetical protein